MKIDSYGGRRFLLTLGCGIASTILVWFGKISGGEYVTIVSLTIAAYITGNVTQKKIEVKNDGSNTNISGDDSQRDGL